MRSIYIPPTKTSELMENRFGALNYASKIFPIEHLRHSFLNTVSLVMYWRRSVRASYDSFRQLNPHSTLCYQYVSLSLALSRSAMVGLSSISSGRGEYVSTTPLFSPTQTQWLRKDSTPAPNNDAIRTTPVTGIANAQKIHCPFWLFRISLVFIPKILEIVERGRKIIVTIVKT